MEALAASPNESFFFGFEKDELETALASPYPNLYRNILLGHFKSEEQRVMREQFLTWMVFVIFGSYNDPEVRPTARMLYIYSRFLIRKFINPAFENNLEGLLSSASSGPISLAYLVDDRTAVGVLPSDVAFIIDRENKKTCGHLFSLETITTWLEDKCPEQMACPMCDE
jgi:hypothetical protein